MRQFSWAWHPHPEVWALCALMLWAYFAVIKRHEAKNTAPAATRRQKISFVLGVITLFVAADYPIHDIAERSLYSVHMVQHMLLSLVMPPLLLGGTPAWMFRAIVRPSPVWRVVKTLSRPVIALVVFNVVIVVTHWPALVNRVVGNELAHFGTHALLVGAAMVMWMPVMSPVLEIPRLSYPGQMIYLFLQSLVPTVPASFLTFGSHPLYKVYESMPRLGGISALTDQLTAGLIMKIVGGFLLWGWIASLFAKWWKIEKAGGVDVLKWRDVDRELNRMELSK